MNKSDLKRDNYMLLGGFARKGYDWWWHNFTGINPETGEERAFYVEYYIINPELSPAKIVLGQSEESKRNGNRPSYAMLNVGTWGKEKKQLHAFFPMTECKIHPKKLDVAFGMNRLTEKRMRGSVKVTEEQAADPGYMSDAGEMSFDVTINKKIAFNVGFGASTFFRFLNAFEMFWHAEGMKTLYRGNVYLDGVKYEIKPETSYGYADKNWGKDYTSPWLWFSSWNLKSRITNEKLHNSVFDMGGGKPKAFGIPFKRKLLIDIFHEGVNYEYNFSKFWTHPKIKFNCYETYSDVIWEIEAENKTSRIKFCGKCSKDEMLLIAYEAPDGKKRHNRLWNGGTGTGRLTIYNKDNQIIDDIDVFNAGCEYGEYTES